MRPRDMIVSQLNRGMNERHTMQRGMGCNPPMHVHRTPSHHKCQRHRDAGPEDAPEAGIVMGGSKSELGGLKKPLGFYICGG
jgi:hypothetical protein